MFKIFFTALMFYTRIPCPKWTPHSPEALNKATVFFPVIGWIAGALAGIVFFIFAQAFSTLTAAFLATLATILLTGAFHEDGFADCCDGFGGGWDKDRILTIMKDSQIGAYGAIGLVMILGLKISLIDDIFFLHGYLRDNPVAIILIFIVAHTLSRFAACCIVAVGTYARENDEVGAKAKPLAKGLSPGLLLIAAIFTAIPLIALIELSYAPQYAVVIVPITLITWRAYHYFKKWIGGYTGDCLGAVQQVCEVACYGVFALLL